MARKHRHCMTRKSRLMEPTGDRTDLRALLEMPPWDWPSDARLMFHKVLTDTNASESDRLVAAELAGDFTVIDDALSDALLGIVSSPGEPEAVRAAAAISLGPVLENADTSGFDDPDNCCITERTFRRIQLALHKLYPDAGIPKSVRRRILEASVRSPQDWHGDAIRHAYSSGDRDWMLTAVFSMRWVRGFEDSILEALQSGDTDIQYEAILAAGNWEMNAALSHIVALVDAVYAPKRLRVAAIGAVGEIAPRNAGEILVDLTDSDDPEIAEAAADAIASADVYANPYEDEDGDEDEEDDAGDWIH